MKKFNLSISCGDINGIGPEIIIKTLQDYSSNRSVIFNVFIPFNVFNFYYNKLKSTFSYKIHSLSEFSDSSTSLINIIDLGKAKMESGRPTKLSGSISYKSITNAADHVKKNFPSALITGPISKEAFSMAGINYPGHTELLADISSSKNFSMFFIANDMKIALATIHKPLKKISKLITSERLTKLFNLVITSLKQDFKITDPKVAVLGLNPHAGENGLLGSEENDIISPLIKNRKYKNNFYGPFVPDAFWANKLYMKFDMVIAMYHDQGLIPFKMMHYKDGVNYTAGLDFIRTSPDHGTAYDIAGNLVADNTSFKEAIKTAIFIIKNRKGKAD